jgi:hypothetical protein
MMGVRVIVGHPVSDWAPILALVNVPKTSRLANGQRVDFNRVDARCDPVPQRTDKGTRCVPVADITAARTIGPKDASSSEGGQEDFLAIFV